MLKISSFFCLMRISYQEVASKLDELDIVSGVQI